MDALGRKNVKKITPYIYEQNYIDGQDTSLYTLGSKTALRRFTTKRINFVFQFYNKWLSLAGAIICISLMIAIDRNMSATVACAVGVFYTIAARKHNGTAVHGNYDKVLAAVA